MPVLSHDIWAVLLAVVVATIVFIMSRIGKARRTLGRIMSSVAVGLFYGFVVAGLAGYLFKMPENVGLTFIFPLVFVGLAVWYWRKSRSQFEPPKARLTADQLASLSRVEALQELAKLLSLYRSRGKRVGWDTALYQDLGIVGNDAGELLDAVHDRFGTRFEGFEFTDYFPNDHEYYWNPPRWFGFKSLKRKRLSTEHMVDVIQKGAWFEPQDAPVTD